MRSIGSSSTMCFRVVRRQAPRGSFAHLDHLRLAHRLEERPLVFNDVASGNAFAKIIESLGLTERLQDKITRTGPAEVATRVLAGKGNDIGVGTVSLIIADKRVKLIGVLPPHLQSYIIYAAAPMTSSSSPEATGEFIRFLTLSEARNVFAAAGVD